MTKNELVSKIKMLDGLTNDEKSALINLLRKQKKYGLVWEDKPEDVEEKLREEVLDKVELCALPAAIYDAYNAVLKPMKNNETANAEVFEDEDTSIKEQSSLFFDEEGGNA